MATDHAALDEHIAREIGAHALGGPDDSLLELDENELVGQRMKKSKRSIVNREHLNSRAGRPTQPSYGRERDVGPFRTVVREEHPRRVHTA
jgi:hypothetical protein